MSIESTISRVATINGLLSEAAQLAQGTAALTGGTAAPSSTTTAASAASAASGSFAAALEQASLGLGAEGSGGEAGAAGPGSATQAGLSPYVAATGYAVPGAAGYPASAPYSPAGSVAAQGGGYPPSVAGGGLAAPGAPSYATPALSGSYPAGAAPAYGVTGAAGTSGEAIGARIVQIAESQAGQAEQPPGSNESPAIATYRSATAGSIPGAPWCAYFASWVARQAGEPIGSEGQGLGAVSEIWSWAQSTGRAIANGPGVVPKPGDLIVFGDEHVGIVRGVLPNGEIATVEGNYENKVALNVRSPSEPTGYVEMS